MGEQFVPEVPKADLQVLLQDFAQARRDLFDERKNSERTISAERERARWEIERVRVEASQKMKALESENDALARALGRLQGENDRLREENVILRHRSEQAPRTTSSEAPAEKREDVSGSAGVSLSSKPAVMITPMHKVAMVPSQEPSVLGKSVPVVQ